MVQTTSVRPTASAYASAMARARSEKTNVTDGPTAIGLRTVAGSRRIGRGPRLQDFRHCFATRKLIEWYRAGVDVGREMPKLTTYLGHVDVAHTYWYLEAVPELQQLATDRVGGRYLALERWCSHLEFTTHTLSLSRIHQDL